MQLQAFNLACPRVSPTFGLKMAPIVRSSLLWERDREGVIGELQNGRVFEIRKGKHGLDIWLTDTAVKRYRVQPRYLNEKKPEVGFVTDKNPHGRLNPKGPLLGFFRECARLFPDLK